MLRVLRFLLIAAILLTVIWWIGGLPGEVVGKSGPYIIRTSVPAALLIIFLVAWLFTVLLRILARLRGATGSFGAWRFGRQKKQGEIALQRAIVALGAEDAPVAKAEAARALGLLGETPLTVFTSAEAARLTGDHEAAKQGFLKLTQIKDFAFLGHRGLLRESETLGELEAAGAHADAAEAAYPNSPWLKAQKLAFAVRQKAWASALELAKTPGEIAALAVAAAHEAQDAKAKLNLAKRAVKAEPGLGPAVVALADALRENGKQRAAKRALLDGWKASPNPMIAHSFLKPFATPIEQAQAATELAAVNPAHPESELLLAQTSLAAKLTGEAERHAKLAVGGLKDQRAHAVLAALQDRGQVNAPNPAWVCNHCHAQSADWAPVCRQCQTIGGLHWLGEMPKPP